MKLQCDWALLPDGWERDVALEIDARGQISAVTQGKSDIDDADRVPGFVIPGMANLHSHAFQRAMAGIAEARTHQQDSFWTWRDLMYRFASRITPEQAVSIATYLYVEMLKAGFTSVVEFHYLHHDIGGAPYAEPAEMSHRMIDAASEAGIALTHLPVLYAYSDFGGRPPHTQQARFLHSAETYARLFTGLHARYRLAPNLRIGAALHSLRAVSPDLMYATLSMLDDIDSTAPIHIHIAEQTKEVEDCVAWSGQRPVEWLLDHAPVDDRWCLVHATHIDKTEVARLATSCAVAGLCPTTEANLGDGLFPADTFLQLTGRIGIGTDSHVNVSVADELRLLEYGQRLVERRRAVLAAASQPSPGQHLYVEAARGGAQAAGFASGRIARGCRADLVVLDPEHPALWNKSSAQVLDSWLFAGDSSCVRDVMTGGTWRIVQRRHPQDAAIAHNFRKAQTELMQ